jgi:tetratricopeptide (TPR) repeat protein
MGTVTYTGTSISDLTGAIHEVDSGAGGPNTNDVIDFSDAEGFTLAMPNADASLIALEQPGGTDLWTAGWTESPAPEAAKRPDKPQSQATEQSLFAEEFARGQAQYRTGCFAEAAAIFARLCEAHKRDSNAYRLLGLCRVRLGDKDAALVALARAKELAPNDPWADLHLGLGLHAAGRYAEAAVLFRACQPRLPDDPAPSLNLAAALLELGHNREALKAARKAVRRGPNLPQAHYTLAMARLACGELDLAEREFREALRLNSKFADAWVNLGLIRYRRSDVEGAKTAMQRALAADPAHRAANANLAVLIKLSGNSRDAEALLKDLLVRDPDSFEARLNLSTDLLRDNRTAEVIALLDRPPAPSEPRLRIQWDAQRALAFIQSGRPEAAREILTRVGEAPPDLAPMLLWRRLLLAEADRDAVQARDIAGRIEVALADGRAMVPELRIMTNFDLARFWMLHDEPDRGFPCWAAGHKLLQPFQPFSRQVEQQVIDANLGLFSRARLHEGPRAGNRDQAPVFIVGMPRSGTTLAEQIIAAHPQVYGAGERTELTSAFWTLGGRSKNERDHVERLAALDQPALDVAATDYLARLHALAPDAKRIVDKMPANARHLGLVGLMLPGARIINCVRDPRDIGLSVFTFRFYGYHPYAHDLGDLGWFIGRHHQLMDHWHAALPNPILTLALKDWVEDFAGTLRRVLDFLDLPYDAACERFYEHEREVRTVSRAQVKQPINARGLGRWKRFEKHLQPLLAELELAGISPDSDAIAAAGGISSKSETV